MKASALALRNLLRNRRRSITTLLAMIVGAVSILLFGGYVRNVVYGLQTGYVRGTGHLQLQQRDFQQFGSGDPVVYGVADYQRVINVLTSDPVLAPMLTVVTPIIQFNGIAGNFDAGVSSAVAAIAVDVPGQIEMHKWDDYGVGAPPPPTDATLNSPEDGVTIGTGVARILQLCGALNVPNCPSPPPAAKSAGAPMPRDVAQLAQDDAPAASPRVASAHPHIELLAATAGGAPNVARLQVFETQAQGVKQLDEVFIGMHLTQAQRLLYGRSAPEVTAIQVQLQHTSQLPAARQRVQQLIATTLNEHPLAVYDFRELNPFYGRSIAFLDAIFTFISVLIGAIVLFTVGNTMSAAIVERTVEIGTLRAMGLRRLGLRRLFVSEGLLLGLIGAAAGELIAILLVTLINHSGISYTPPVGADRVPLTLRVLGETPLLVGTAAGLIAVALLSAWWPARRAAALRIVEALRHA
jgi:putative ABC transport system permease protein